MTSTSRRNDYVHYSNIFNVVAALRKIATIWDLCVYLASIDISRNPYMIVLRSCTFAELIPEVVMSHIMATVQFECYLIEKQDTNS